MKSWLGITLIATSLAWVTNEARPADTAPYLKTLKAVRAEGVGNEEASKAFAALVALGPDALFDTLAAMDDADARSSNWLRAAVDSIAERAIASGTPPDAAKFEAFVREKKHSGLSRGLAYEWLRQIDAKAADRLLPSLLDDPGAALRRAAVARAIQDAKAVLDRGDKAASVEVYRKILTAARDRDQVELLIKQLKDLGLTVDVRTQFGFIQQWQLLGPLDNSGGSGFAKAYPPEQGIDLKAVLEGKKNKELRWIKHVTEDPYGKVDLNTALGKNMGAVAYAYVAVTSATERPVEIRAGSNNAVKIFLNGKQIYFREEYHHGDRVDQHVGAGTLKAGRNEIIVKVCQNEQTEKWAQTWSFQLRICDSLGGAVPVALVTE